MTVAELIIALQAQPPDVLVAYSSMYEPTCVVKTVELDQHVRALSVDGIAYDPEHKEVPLVILS